MHGIRFVALVALSGLAACKPTQTAQDASPAQAQPAAPTDPAAALDVPPPEPAATTAAPPTQAPPAPVFVGKVWRVVRASDGSEPGQTYAFWCCAATIPAAPSNCTWLLRRTWRCRSSAQI